MKMGFWDNFWSACFVACIFFFSIIVCAIIIGAFFAAVLFVSAYLFGTWWFIWPIVLSCILIYSLIMGIYLTIKDHQAEKKEIIREKH